MKARVKKLEAKSRENFAVIWPTAYRQGDTECRTPDEVAYFVYPEEPPFRVDRKADESMHEFETRADGLAKGVLKSTFRLPWRTDEI